MKKPFNALETLEQFAECETEKIEYSKETLESLYESKWIFEDMLQRDLANKEFTSAKLTRKRLGEIKDEIIACKKAIKMMQNISKEEKSVA